VRWLLGRALFSTSRLKDFSDEVISVSEDGGIFIMSRR
jgi:hypothetical protein